MVYLIEGGRAKRGLNLGPLRHTRSGDPGPVHGSPAVAAAVLTRPVIGLDRRAGTWWSVMLADRDNRLVPNLDFYAADDDWAAVVESVFELGLFRVFESDSEPGRELREFRVAADIATAPQGRHLELFVVGSGPEPTVSRIDLSADSPGDPTFRHCCEGWGLVQLYYGGPFGTRELRWSHTNHNSAKRAATWAAAVPRLGDPAAWDWAAVTSASGRLNRVIRRMAVSRIGSHPVLPHAGRLIADGGLRHEYGTGVHATPSHG
ncbi:MULTISPECIES: hypothetical protein [Micromonospora]|uniref:hypothetical protein n=1 Tax=Micromonospora TaxID=1873 RepID=UPI001E3F1F2B|nr:hypothetical protein [Micromonospora sp. NBRC 110038]